MYKKMCHKIIITAIIVVAFALAITVSVLPQKGLAFIMFASRFFDVMLPALAVAALLKYLIHCDKWKSDCSKKQCDEEKPGSCS